MDLTGEECPFQRCVSFGGCDSDRGSNEVLKLLLPVRAPPPFPSEWVWVFGVTLEAARRLFYLEYGNTMAQYQASN